MTNKTLNIGLVEDDKEVLSLFPKIIEYSKGDLGHMDIKVSLFPTADIDNWTDINNLLDKLTSDPLDQYYMDFRLGTDKIRGTEIAQLIRSKVKRPVSIIEFSNYDQDIIMEQAPTTIEALKGKIFDTSIKKINMAKLLPQTILEYAYKPLSIGIAGLGTLGKGFLEVLRNKDYVSKFNLFSPSLFQDKSEEEVREGLQLLSEEDRERFHIKHTLEDALVDTDCILICTSNHNSEYISKRPDRTDLFQHAVKKIGDYGNILVANNYQGLVFVGTNSSGDSLHYLNEKGLSEDQLTFSISVDTSRIIRNVLADARTNKDPDYRGKIKQHLAENVYGLHGVPKILTRGEFNSDLEISIQDDASVKAIMDGQNIVINARKMNDYSKDTARESESFFEGLAHYKKNPAGTASYCFYQVDPDTKGFIALPVSF